MLGGSCMANFTKFRTSMGGFNRADVTEYIAGLCAEHQNTLRKLQNDQADLTEKLQALERQLAELNADHARLQEDYQQLKDQEEYKDLVIEEQAEVCEDQKAKIAALEEQLAAAETALAAIPTEDTCKEEAPDYPSLELEAYRRAEATERMAAERADRMQQQLCELLDNVSDRYGETGQEIQTLADDIRVNLKRLEDSLSDLDVIFDDTTARFRQLEPAEPVLMD